MESYSYHSGDSSPRSRDIDFENPPPWEDSLGNQPPPNYRVKFLCSYGGKIHPRPNDNQLTYVGGETKILAVERNIRFVTLLSKVIAMCESDSILFKYQLPGEDLDALISVTNDDDLEHMMHEYERMYRASPKPARLRVFIFPTLNQSLNSSARSFGSDEVKLEKERFVEALNSAPIMAAPAQQTQPPANNVDFLFGLEKSSPMGAPPPAARMKAMVENPIADDRFAGLDPIQKHIQDLQRLRLEEQQGRKSDESLGNDFTGGGGEYYKPPERFSQVSVQGGVSYWTDNQSPGGGVYQAASNEQQVYMMNQQPPPSSSYHAPMMRQVTGAPTQGYYVQRMMTPEAAYRDHHHHQQQQQQQQVQQQQMQQQQQQMYSNMEAAGYSESYGMVRQANSGGGGGVGVMTEGGYAPMAYDSVTGRQIVYGVMGAPAATAAPMQMGGQYQAMCVDMRQAAGALNPEVVGKGVPKVAQNPI